MKPLRSALVVLLLVAALAAGGCGGIGSSRGTNSGAGDDDSFYRANNFDTALEAVRGKVGPSGDILEIRVEARRTNFTVRKGKTESATGYSARAATAATCATSTSTWSARARSTTSPSRPPTSPRPP